jgi:tRNA uridine 5-carboxymethylaminomethyl modification enzyme
MFTSRAEHRLLLRQDNADLRLTEIGAAIGLASPLRVDRLRAKRAMIEQARRDLDAARVDHVSLSEWLKRPDFHWEHLPEAYHALPPEVAQQVETDIKYAGYIAREQLQIEKALASEEKPIPLWLDFDSVHGLKTEARAKLKAIRPRTFGQAARISGINPSDIALLLVWSKRGAPVS